MTGQAVILKVAYGTEKNGIALFSKFNNLGRKRMTESGISDAAD